MHHKYSILPIFLTVFIDLIGVGIVLPALAPLILGVNNPLLPKEFEFSRRTTMLGLLVACYPLMQFFGAPILGSLSDNYGRKKLLLFSLAGTFIGYVLFGFGILTNNIFLLFLGRIIDGFTGGNISISMSAIADISDEKSKAKNFGTIGMAFGLGFIVGPYIGGKLSDPSIVSWFDYATPFWFAAILSLFNMCLLIWYFKETPKKQSKTKIDLLMSLRNIKKAMSLTNFRIVFIFVFLLNFGFGLFAQFFQVHLIENFSFTQSQIGDLWAYTGICIALCQGVVVRLVAKKFEPKGVLRIVPFFLSIALAALIFPNQAFYFFLITPFIALFNGLTHPNTTALISNMTSKEAQGEILGINQSILALSYALPGFVGGFLASLTTVGPLIASSIIVLFAWAIFVICFRSSQREC